MSVRVELQLRGTSYRLVTSVFSDCEISLEDATTLITAEVADDTAAFELIERARTYGFRVTSWMLAPSH
jgi:hypothetical protein